MSAIQVERITEAVALAISIILLSVVAGLSLSIGLYGRLTPILPLGLIGLFACIAWNCRPVARSSGVAEQAEGSAGYVLLGAICLGVFLFGRQFEYASIWGDVGVYVNAASHLRSGGTLPFTLPALGYDLAGGRALAAPLGMINPVQGGGWQFHGLPVWPALMGFSQLPGDGRSILAVLAGINVLLFFFVARIFVRDSSSAALTTLLFAVLPLFWHQALYPTAEMLLLAIVLSTLLLAVQLRHSFVWLALGVYAYGAVHVGVLLLTPVMALILSLIALLVRERGRAGPGLAGVACGISAYLAYLLAGLVTPGAPAGLGVRESVLLFLLGSRIPAADLVLAIVLGRVITVFGDFGYFVSSILHCSTFLEHEKST